MGLAKLNKRKIKDIIISKNKMKAMHGFRECRDEIGDLFRSRCP